MTQDALDRCGALLDSERWPKDHLWALVVSGSSFRFYAISTGQLCEMRKWWNHLLVPCRGGTISFLHITWYSRFVLGQQEDQDSLPELQLLSSAVQILPSEMETKWGLEPDRLGSVIFLLCKINVVMVFVQLIRDDRETAGTIFIFQWKIGGSTFSVTPQECTDFTHNSLIWWKDNISWQQLCLIWNLTVKIFTETLLRFFR